MLILAVLSTLASFGMVYWINKREHTHKDFFQLLRVVIFIVVLTWLIITLVGSFIVSFMWQTWESSTLIWIALILLYVVTVFVLYFVMRREMTLEGKNVYFYAILFVVIYGILTYLSDYLTALITV